MITAADLATILTTDQYNDLKAKIDGSAVVPTIRVTLKQYAPEWETASVPGALSGILTPQTDHDVTLTAQGNWRLSYQGSNSDIYWPFQVRSLDAVSLPGSDYDLIAMATDLPPIVDTTISDQKRTFSYQRVQGIVLWRYNRVTGQWSDHREWDVIDSTQNEARANVKLTVSGDYVFMTYGKAYGGVSGLAITRSRNGLDWEDPVLMDIGNGDLPPLTALGRDGDYMYLISASTCRRSLATEYMPPAATGLTQDITDYVLSASATIGIQRQLQLELANPDSILTTAPAILSKKVTTRLLFEAGYLLSDNTYAYIPVITGDVVEWSTSEQLPIKHLTMVVKDSLSLLDVIGTSEALEWQGLSFDGDNFCPVNSDDLTGATGLRKSQIKNGKWFGTQNGLKLECDGRERQVLAVFDSRVFNGMLSGEYSFYQQINPVRMGKGSTGTETAAGTEYAGPMFRWLDEHNCWLVKVTPAGHVSLVQRLENPANPHLHAQDYAPSTHLQYIALHTDTVKAEADISARPDNYWSYYWGRISVVWKYGLVKVYQHFPGRAAAELISYEVEGFGNTPYTNQATPIVQGYVGHVAYSPKDGYEEMAINGDAQSGTDLWVAENLDQSNVTSVSGHSRVSDTEDCSTKVIKVVTASDGPDPGVFYRLGAVEHPLGWDDGAHYDFTVHAFIESGDIGIDGVSDASVCIKSKIYYTDQPNDKPSQKGVKQFVTSFGSWVDYSWSVDTLSGKTIRRLILSFVDQRGVDFRVGPTTFYVADLHIKKTVPKAYIYIGNVDYSDADPVYTAHDALNALYAFSGSHLIDRKALVNLTSTSGWLSTDVVFPYVVEMDISTSSGSTYLTGTTNPILFTWGTDGCRISLASNGYERKITDTISQGRLRLAVTSASSEGKTFSNDLNNICDWITVAAYLDGRFLMSGTIPISGSRIAGASITDYASTDVTGFKVGTSVTVANLRIDDLHRHIPYFSIDPTEVAASAQGRIVGVTRAVSLYRFNDHILIGRPPLSPDTNNPAWTIPDMLRTQLNDSYNAVVPVHFRLIGAWTEKETFDRGAMLKAWRHFFFKKDDPNLMTTNEMDLEASYILKDLAFARNRESVAVRFNPLIEFNDVISAGGFAWLLDQAAWTFQHADNAIKPTGSVTLKRIVSTEGTPSLSASPSSSNSSSASRSPSASTSPTFSPSASLSPSSSASASISPSASASPSPSPSLSRSPSASASASVSPSASTSASVSPSASASGSVSPSASDSPSVSPSASESLSVSPSSSLSPSASASPSV